MTGRFIVLEGIDGSGTTTQCHALAAALRARGHAVRETREPSSGEIGRLVRERLAQDAAPLSHEALALLFAADRLDHVDREIRPALESGAMVVCDRYVMSSWAYQSLDCDPAWVRTLNAHAPWPDLTIVLEVPAELGWARVQARRAREADPPERFDVPSLQQRLTRAYESLARDPRLTNVSVVDGAAELARVTEQVLRICVEAGL